MLGIIIPLAIGTIATVSVVARAKKPEIKDDGDERDNVRRIDDDRGAKIDAPTIAAHRVDVRNLAAMIGAPEIWQDFFAMTAYGESRMTTNAGLGIRIAAPPWVRMNASENEAKAAVKSYRNNASWLAPCWPALQYGFGSGGIFAMLPAAAIAAFKTDPVYKCVHPWSIFDPVPAMIYAAWFARRLQGWSNWNGTVLSMRVGWGNPSAMHKPSAKGRAKFAAHAQAVNLPASFLDAQLPRWRPAPARELWRSLGADDGWLPEKAAA